MNLTWNLLLEEGSRRLKEAGVEEADLDAKYLLFEAFDINLSHFIMERNRPFSANEKDMISVENYYRMIDLRSARIPLQQITGNREFMGLPFLVDENVLIPRQDTETLVELVLKEYKGKNPSLLDMCTGSGCIAISLAKLGGFDSVTAADVSEKALQVARKNQEALLKENQITFLLSNLFEAFDEDKTFDVIVSNPPYIPTDVIKGLSPEVRDHEPMLALDGKKDGLYFYKRLAIESRKHLNSLGAVYFEIGYDQKEAVSGLLKDAGFKKIRSFTDAAGLDRIVSGIYE